MVKIAIAIIVVILVIAVLVLYRRDTQPRSQQISGRSPDTPDAGGDAREANLPDATPAALQDAAGAAENQPESPSEPFSEADEKVLEYALDGNYEALKAVFVPEKHLPLRDEQGFTLFMLGEDSGNKDVLALLLEAGANVNDSLDNGITVLHMAVSAEYEETVAELVKRGADVNAKADRDGRTPLMWAASTGNANIVRMLLEAGADITIEDALGYTAEDHAEDDELKKLIRGD